MAPGLSSLVYKLPKAIYINLSYLLTAFLESETDTESFLPLYTFNIGLGFYPTVAGWIASLLTLTTVILMVILKSCN